MNPTLEQQAQQWLENRDRLLCQRRETESELGHFQWRQTAEVNPNLLPEPLRAAANKLLDQQAVADRALDLLHPSEIDALREHFRREMAAMEILMNRKDSQS